MKRRNFIKQLGAASALTMAGGLVLPSFIGEKQRHITILHTNDTHSHIEPFKPNHPRNPNQGGIARRATLIKHIRNENKNTLLLLIIGFNLGAKGFTHFLEPVSVS